MSALRQRVRVTYRAPGEEGEKEVVVEHTAMDVLAWESATGKSALTQDTSFSMLAWFAHHAAVEGGQINGDLKTYEAFSKVCVDVERVADVDPTPPTAKGRASRKTAGASSSAD